MPVGFIIETTDSTSPAEIFGGSWELFGKGRVTVGYDPNDSDFNWVWDNTEEKFNEGGEKDHTLIESEMPTHKHIQNNQGVNYAGAWAMTSYNEGTGSVTGYSNPDNCKASYITNGLKLVETWIAGNDQPHNNLQPYIVVYRWRRVA